MKRWALVVFLTGCSGETICATPEALKLDPNLNATIRDAVEYWSEQGYGWLLPRSGTDCTIPVYPNPRLDYWAAAKTMATDVGPQSCYPQFIEISTADWPSLIEQDLTFRVLAHEVGHLYCQDHTETGVMSSDETLRLR